MNIGQKLRLARDAVGYTLNKASKESDIGESSLCEFENGKREPKFSQLSQLAEVYRRTIEFFLTDEPVVENMMLWREKPDTEEKRKEVETRFFQLCEQYHNLETVMGEIKGTELPKFSQGKSSEFDYNKVDELAEKVRKGFSLGDIPGASLKQILEEKFYVKIFHLDFSGSAISIFSETFGYAILLNKTNKLWRRNFDLAHELFHLLTWNIFRDSSPDNYIPSENEESFANAFASKLLLPTDSAKNRINSQINKDGKITFEKLYEIAREFDVSIEALLWRMLYLYNINKDDINRYIKQAQNVKIFQSPRVSSEPDELPERYCSLAIRALNDGKLSLTQFAKYMGISYRKAQEYLAEGEDFTDEKISISVT